VAKSKARKKARTGEPAPCPGADDVFTAGIALSQAYGILDMLTVACKGATVDGDVYDNSLEQSLYAVMSEVDRAHQALFGYEVRHG
jgi:hypothetical protein